MTDSAVIEIIKAIKLFMVLWFGVNVLRIVVDFIIEDTRTNIELLEKELDE